MKFGIYIPNFEEENPSGASFEQATLRALAEINIDHELYVFTNSSVIIPKANGVTYIDVGKYRLNPFVKLLYRMAFVSLSFLLKLYPSGKIQNTLYFLKTETDTTPLNKALIRNKIRLFWHTFSSERIDIPYIYGVLDCNHWIHSYQPEFAPSSYSWSVLDDNFSAMIKQAAYIIASTEVLKKQIAHIHGVPEQKIRVIPFFTPEISSVRLFGGTDELINDLLPEKFLFYPARLMSQKNHVTVLYALKSLKEKYNLEIPLVMVGKDKGNKRHIFSVVERLGLSNNVIYLGEVSFNNLTLLYRKAFALVYASMNGPDNFPPLEAFSLGCPVIASRVEGAEEQLGNNALYFDVTDEEELADRIFELHSNDNLREELIKRGNVRARLWTANEYVKSLMQIINEFDTISRAWDDDFAYISKRWTILMK